MEIFFIVFLFIALLCLIVGLIKPTLFIWLLRSHASRGVVGLIFGGLCIISFVAIGVIATVKNAKENSGTATTSEEKPAIKEMSNWSGYIKYGQQDTITSVSGDWIVPSVQPSDKIQTAASWIGIGGYATQGLIQIATQSIAGLKDGVPGTLYDAVWECLPNPSVPIPDFNVNAGDKVSASIKKIDAGWALSLKNNNTERVFEGTSVCVTDGSTAEWILENPPMGVQASFKSEIMPKASPIIFSNILVNGLAPGKSNMIEIIMKDSNGQIVASPNSSLNKSGQEFTVRDVRP